MKKIRTTLFCLGYIFLTTLACKEKKAPTKQRLTPSTTMQTNYKLSLAQWSMHKMILEEGLSPYQFAAKAKAWGFTGLEYVSGLYYKELEKDNFSKEAMANFVAKNNAQAKKYGLVNLLIMVDGQGDLAAVDSLQRQQAVQNHYKWVDAASAMGCQAIRVNLNGTQEPQAWHKASVAALTQLAQYAKNKNISILVENHGGPSSNAQWLTKVMQAVNLPNCGTLPDFGNFCVKRSAGDYYKSDCIEEYDKYQGVQELMLYAQAVSAKSYNFNTQGEEDTIDYGRMLQIIQQANYKGYIGVEFEGSQMTEEEGILATKNLILHKIDQLNI